MKNLSLTLTLLFLACYGFAQQPSKLSYETIDSLMAEEYYKGDYHKAMEYMQLGKNQALKEFGDQDSVFANFLAWGSFLYKETGQYTEAIEYALQAKNIQAKVLGTEHPFFANTLNGLANLYLDMGYTEKAEALFLQAKDIRARVLGEQDPAYAESLNNLAILYQDMGNYEKAEHLFLQAQSIRGKALGEKHIDFAASLNNLASLYKAMGNYEKAEELYIQTKAIWQEVLGENHPYVSYVLNNLAGLYQRTGKYEKAEIYYLQALSIMEKTTGIQQPNYPTTLNNLAAVYEDMGNYEKAEQSYLKAKDIRLSIFDEHHPLLAQNICNMASLYKKMGKLDKAFRYAQLSIIALSEDIDSSFQDWVNLDKHKYSSVLFINPLIQRLLSIIYAQYQQTENKQTLESYYQINQAAMRLNEQLRNNFSGEQDKLRSLASNSNFVLQGISAGIALKQEGYAQEVFGFAEMNKGVLLMEAVKTERAYRFGDLPDSLVSKEKELQKKHASLEVKLLEKRYFKEKDSLLAEFNKTNHEISSFSEMLHRKYPKYSTLKYKNNTASAADIQSLLDNNTALLEYVLSDSVIYIFYLDKKVVEVLEHRIDKELLAENINKLHNSLSRYELLQKEPQKSYNTYTKTAYWFYQNLLEKTLEKAKGIEHLIIIPDKELGYLPFETFLVEPAKGDIAENYGSLHYLVNDYRISYNYSATLWKDNMETKHSRNNGLMFGVAANYNYETDTSKQNQRLPNDRRLRDILIPLPAAGEEVKALAENFKGYFVFDSLATERNFKAKAHEYSVIHLAMHGLLNEKHPILSSLAFTEDGDSMENNFLYAYEISKMQLNADLVVLSACETGFGKFETGNGTASLARAFMYAGVQSLVVSLWQVNDQSTSIIMQSFYKNLAKGMDKAEALRQAKLAYIRSVDGIAAHPAFWAPFVQLGDSRPIAVDVRGGGLSMWWIGGGLAALAAVGGGAMAMRRRSKGREL